MAIEPREIEDLAGHEALEARDVFWTELGELHACAPLLELVRHDLGDELRLVFFRKSDQELGFDVLNRRWTEQLGRRLVPNTVAVSACTDVSCGSRERVELRCRELGQVLLEP